MNFHADLNIKEKIILILRLISVENIDIVEKYFSLNILSNLIFDIFINNSQNTLYKTELPKFLLEISMFINKNNEFKNRLRKNCKDELDRFRIIIEIVEDDKLKIILQEIL